MLIYYIIITIFDLIDASDTQFPCPETNSSFPSIITFSWFDSLAWTGYKRAILESDLWDLNPRDQSATVAPQFDKNWAPLLKAANLQSRSDKKESLNKSQDSEKVIVQTGKKENLVTANLSIFVPLIKSFGWTFLSGSVIKAIHDVMVFISPMILRRIIAFSEPVCEGCSSSPVWQGRVATKILRRFLGGPLDTGSMFL